MPYKSLETRRFHAKEYRDGIRLEVLTHYSTGTPICSCCGETEIKFLAIDHVDGGGTIHRKAIGTSNMCYWIKKNGFPEGFQILCHNCNMAKGFYGICPHKLSEGENV